MSIAPGALTNRDVLTLAGAGFSEDFIVDAIHTSQTQFDVSAPALAELAKHAVNERIIRAMMDQAAFGGGAGAAEAAQAEAQADGLVPVVMPTPEAPRRGKTPKAPRLQPAVLAISSQTPYYEWKSYFWGLIRKRVGVAPKASPAAAVPLHLGPLYQQVRAAPQTLRAGSPGIPQMVYYTVAP